MLSDACFHVHGGVLANLFFVTLCKRIEIRRELWYNAK